MRHSHFLKITCILMMLSSLVRFFFGLMMLNTYTTASTFGAIAPSQLSMAVLTMLVHMACALSELVGGFIGALHWEEPLLSHKCVRWGIAALSFGLIGNLLQHVIEYDVSYVAWITGAGVPGLFLCASIIFWYFGKYKYKDIHNLGIKTRNTGR